ncbi:MAG: hypothetical protein LC793_25280 [Thermomicrobia bacterium]|nr:hypothetical protein [Thermomicrobia bacterium]
MSIKEDVHRLVDALPDDELPAARRLLESLRTKEHDPFIQHLMRAPIDDEPTTSEEDAGTAEAREELKRGEGRSLSEVRAELLRG